MAPPDPALASSQVVVNARRSVIKVLGTAPSCSRRIEGSGFVYADERVMTNAHVVAGTREVQVESNGERLDGTVVVYDPERDLAVIYVPGLHGAGRCRSSPSAGGDRRQRDRARLSRWTGRTTPSPARVRDVSEITGPDIYDSGDVTREIYTIRRAGAQRQLRWPAGDPAAATCSG